MLIRLITYLHCHFLPHPTFRARATAARPGSSACSLHFLLQPSFHLIGICASSNLQNISMIRLWWDGSSFSGHIFSCRSIDMKSIVHNNFCSDHLLCCFEEPMLLMFTQLYLLVLPLLAGWLGWTNLSHQGSYQMPVAHVLSWISWLIP